MPGVLARVTRLSRTEDAVDEIRPESIRLLCGVFLIEVADLID